VLSRDQQHHLLPLLFTRDVTGVSYALSRFAAIFTAVFLVALAPLLLLYLGEVGIAKDPAATFAVMGSRIWPVLAQSTLTAFAMTGIGVALAVWSSRRAYATAGIFGTFLLLAAISSGLDDLAGVSLRTAELMDPLRAMRTMAMILFGETNRGMELNPPASIGVYVALTLGIGTLGLVVMTWRMHRIRS
jgi:ABC-2 type transport system permease protein